jgi:DNA topoisomerase-1
MRGQPSRSSSSPRNLPPSPVPPGLVYVSDDMPGFTRVRRGEHFAYRDTKGQLIRDKDEIQRIRQLAIPPAYTRVWICPLRNGHLQATGRDARGRKQYRYHAGWREQRDENKFDRMEAFGMALPRIRARVARDLQPRRGQPLGRTLVLATLVRLLDTTFLRVGNDEYARDNGSYGLTTLRNPHAGVRGSVLQLRFRGKSGVMQNVRLDDPKVAAVVRRCQQLPGQELFQYEDENGLARSLGSGDVNDYLAEISGPRGRAEGGEKFTAKDFRTWHGTVQALELTRLACSANASTPAGYSAKAVLAEVAGLLGNTPAVCRKSYIHPAVMSLGAELSKDAETMGDIWDTLAAGKKPRRLYIAEGRLLAFLKNRRKKIGRKA